MDFNEENHIFKIEITDFINPSQFWFQIYQKSKSLIQLEQKLEKDFIANNEKYEPVLNDEVLVYDNKTNRYFRGKIEDIQSYFKGSHKYLIWARDLGLFYEVYEDSIKKLSPELKEVNIRNIYSAGLNIMPVRQETNSETDCVAIGLYHEWQPDAIKLFEIFLNNHEICEFEIEKQIGEKYFGDLKVILNNNSKISITDLLVEKGLAYQTPYIGIVKLDKNLAYSINKAKNIGSKSATGTLALKQVETILDNKWDADFSTSS